MNYHDLNRMTKKINIFIIDSLNTESIERFVIFH